MLESTDNTPRHDHLYKISIEELQLSELAIRTLARTGMMTIGDCVDLFNRGNDVLITARPPVFTILIDELKPKLKKEGYWKYVINGN